MVLARHLNPVRIDFAQATKHAVSPAFEAFVFCESPAVYLPEIGFSSVLLESQSTEEFQPFFNIADGR
jgi:hypothetical protein